MVDKFRQKRVSAKIFRLERHVMEYYFREVKMSGVKWKAVTGRETVETLLVKGPDDIRMDYVEDLGSNSFWKKIPFKENANLLNVDSKNKDEL